MIYLSKVRSYFDQHTIGKFSNWIVEYMLMNFIVRRVKSGLLLKSDVEPYFDAIAIAQNTVDRCATLAGMKSKYTYFITTLFI